jgi:hypothetical protein
MTEIIDTLTELKRMHQLNLELLEQLSVSCSWLMEHSVPIPNAETICSLLRKATILLSEIQADQPTILQYRKLADETKQPPRTDGEVTESLTAIKINAKRSSC